MAQTIRAIMDMQNDLLRKHALRTVRAFFALDHPYCFRQRIENLLNNSRCQEKNGGSCLARGVSDKG